MSVTLDTHQLLGSAYWWFDPDLSLDPIAPVVGQSSNVMVNVTNTGTDTQQVYVSCYWASASIGITIWRDFTQIESNNNSTSIDAGTSQVILGASWTPTESGHFCLLAVAVSSDNPMPPASPSTRVPGGTNPQVVQHNFWVNTASAGDVIKLYFQRFHPRTEQQQIHGKRIPLDEAAGQLLRLGKQAAPEIGEALSFTMHTGAAPDQTARGTSSTEAVLVVDPSQEVAPWCEVEVPRDAQPGAAALIDIRTLENGSPVNGGAFLVLVQ